MSQGIMSWREFCKGHYNGYPIYDKDTGEEKDDSDKKKEYRGKIIGYWEKSRLVGKGDRNPNPLQAMEELHEEFPEDSMMIINFTNRNRRDIAKDLEGSDYQIHNEYKREFRGLVKVIQEWENQVKDPKVLDSLEKLIQSKPELYSKPDYMITAMVHRVRRLRKGLRKNPGNLKLADRILKVAYELLPDSNKSGAKDHAILPNDELKLLVEMQKHLQDTRRNKPQLDDNLDDFTSKFKQLYSNNSPTTSPAIAVYYWWALRISYTRARSNLEFKKAEKYLDDMNKVKSEMNDDVKAYINCIEEAEKSGKPRDKEIAEYHKALTEFMHCSNKSVTTKKGKLRKKEGLLYKAALDNNKATGIIPLFSWHSTTQPVQLIARCRKSIINAKTCSSAISYRNSNSAQAMLMLVSIDLLIRIRWYLTGSNIYNTKADWNKADENTQPRRTVDGKSELEIAQELRDEIVHTLKGIQKQIYRDSTGTGEMHDLIDNWAKALEILEFEKQQNYATKPSVKKRGPLGQLCDFCGSMVGWKWAVMKDRKTVWDEDDNISLYGFVLDAQPVIDTKPRLTISTKGPINNPYLRQVGESSSHQ